MIYISRELKLFGAGIASTIIAAVGFATIALVDYNSQQSGFTEQQQLIYINKYNNVSYNVGLLGNRYLISFEPANKALGFLKQNYTIIPAPLRFTEQIGAATKTIVNEYVENKKQQEYIDYVIEEINPYNNANI